MRAGAATLLAALVAGPAAAQDLSLPVRCALGKTCFVQNYADADAGPDYADHACGKMSYDGHDGTDFRIAPGVEADVLAAADGVVRAVRDGEAERTFSAPAAVPSERGCGNAVVVDHPGGLVTTYCHMAKGSVRVAAGEDVARGAPLGRVGASGLTEFRHLHLGVRREGNVVDPFTGHAVGGGCGPGASLWTREAAAELAAAGRTAVLAVGFNDAAVTLQMIEDGTTAAAGPDSPAFVAWGVAVGTEAGDELVLTLKGPGVDLADRGREERPRAQAMRFLGQRRGPAPGTYTARLEIVRDARAVASREATLTVR